MITSLNIKNIATYDSVNGVPIADLKKVNFFFGFNGSGKSTIAKYLRNLSLETSLQNPDFTQCTNVGYNNANHQLVIFNDDFIEENFKRNQELKGVFSLNQSNATIDQQITDEENNIRSNEQLSEKYKNKVELIENDKNAKHNSLLNHCWSQRATFATFSKISLAHSGSKPNHLHEIRNILLSPLGQIPALANLSQTYQTLYESDLKKINITVSGRSYLAIRRIEIKIENLLQEVIVGNEDVDIAGLIQTLNSRNWVELGLTYLDKSGNVCPFCQEETITDDLKEQFNKFFDETYKRKVGEIDNLKNLYKQATDKFIAEISAIQNVFNPNNLVSNLIISLNQLFSANIEVIEDKLEHANEKKNITSLNTFKNDLASVISAIKSNNQLYDDSATNKQTLISEIWKYIANECLSEITNYDNRVVKYNRLNLLSAELKNKYDNKIDIAKQNIETLRSQTVDTKEAVIKINLILKNAGFEGFEIDEKEKVNNISRYYLKRQHAPNASSVFQTLSEGEKNFISFLYFYQLCLGTDDLQNNGSKKKIIVIDDPVSSLDSQAMFIVLTHNFYFYKEVSFNKRPICTDYWHYKIVKINNQTKISGEYNKKINDDYSLLWISIKELKASIPQNSSQNIMIANSMRRIIESYVNFIGLGNESWGALLTTDTTEPTYYIKSSFISSINDDSHKVTALDSVYYQKITTEQPQILFDVFMSIFKSIGKDHYEMMMEETIPV